MEIRTTEENFEIGGRTFVIKKFDPLFGSYIAMKVMKKLNSGKINQEEIITELMGNSFEEFETLQKRVLKYTAEKLPSGNVPVINSEGNIAIIGLDSPTTIALIFKVIFFNLSSFFPEGENPQNPQEGATEL